MVRAQDLVVLLAVAVWGELIGVCNGCGSESIIYQITVRDFLPLWCMRRADFESLNITDPLPPGSTFDRNLVLTSDKFDAFQGDGVCPYQSYIDAGEISGHPDFNRVDIAGWDLGFLFSFEDTYGVNTMLNGTCDLNDVGVPSNRPPNLNAPAGTGDRPVCEDRIRIFTQRMNYTAMDLTPSGLPKPQYCTSDPNGRCGYTLDTTGPETGRIYQTANKYFQDMWFQDNQKYNKRIGTTLRLDEQSSCNGVFEFDSKVHAANEFSTAGIYSPYGSAEFTFNESDFPNPFEAKAWPLTDSKRGQLKGRNKFLHTTELHTFFEYRGNEVFTFAGDDDVWVYVNNILTIELGGFHAPAAQAVNLGHPVARDYLNLTVGEIYTFDMYQAERQPPGSNFRMTTTLAGTCNVLNSKKLFFPDPDGNTIVKSRRVNFNFPPGSVYAGEEIGLLPPGSTSTSTFAFVREKINVGTGFIIDFKFRATGKPEGFAFVLHQRPEGLINFPVSSGPGLGFKGVSNSIALAFDMCLDRGGVSSNCTLQNVTMYYPGAANVPNKPSVVNRRVYDPIMRSLKLGDEHKVKIAFYGRPPSLEVTIDDSLYLRQWPFEPVPVLGSIAAFAGFTATAGEEPGEITVYDWVMESVDVESSNTRSVDFNNTEGVDTLKTMLGDDIDYTGYSIQTFDKCDVAIEFGNRAQNTAGYFVEERDPETGGFKNNRISPLVVPAFVSDAQDGKYTYNLRVLDEGFFSLYFYYGGREKACLFNVSVTGSNYSVHTGNSTEDGCYYGSVFRGVRVFPLTEAPTASPIGFNVPPTENDGTALFVGAIGGGSLAFLACVAAIFLVAFRRRWQKDKEFIEEGARYKLDANTTFSADSPLSQVGEQVLHTQQAILRERAKLDSAAGLGSLGELQTEQDELLEQIRVLKQSIIRNERGSDQSGSSGGREPLGVESML